MQVYPSATPPPSLTRDGILEMLYKQELLRQQSALLRQQSAFQSHMQQMIESYKEPAPRGETQQSKPPTPTPTTNGGYNSTQAACLELRLDVRPSLFAGNRVVPDFANDGVTTNLSSEDQQDAQACCTCVFAILGAIYVICAFFTTVIGLAYAHTECSMVYFNWCLSVFILRMCILNAGMASKKAKAICMQVTIGIVFFIFFITTAALSDAALHSGCDISRDGSGPLLVVGSVMYALVDLGFAFYFAISVFCSCV